MDMEIRKKCNLERMFHDMKDDIRYDLKDTAFTDALLKGDTEGVLALFQDRKMFLDEPSAVDSPYGRFEGKEGIREFSEGFLERFGADKAFLDPVFQTVSGGRIALEAVVGFIVEDAVEEVPFFFVFDLCGRYIEEVRIYCHYSFVPGLTPYRKPIFRPAHLEMGDPGLLTGAMRCYYEALHHAPYCDPDMIHRSFSDRCIVGGYEPWGTPVKTVEEMTKEAHSFGNFLATYIPACVGMRYETIIDNGRTCVIEWVHILSKQGREERNRIAMSGISAYTRDDEGYLCGVRICDYAGHEAEIDWTKTPVSFEEAVKINFVDEFPKGCGMKEQREY